MKGRAIEAFVVPVNVEQNCGVYFLVDGEEIVYVGQSKNMLGRIGAHVCDPCKAFDRVFIYPCEKSSLDAVETIAIDALKPRLNRLKGPGYGGYGNAVDAAEALGVTPETWMLNGRLRTLNADVEAARDTRRWFLQKYRAQIDREADRREAERNIEYMNEQLASLREINGGPARVVYDIRRDGRAMFYDLEAGDHGL